MDLKLILTFAAAGRFIVSIFYWEGKSGQRRAPCFLTGRSLKVDSNVAENNHLVLMYHSRERVKRCGKSAPVIVVT